MNNSLGVIIVILVAVGCFIKSLRKKNTSSSNMNELGNWFIKKRKQISRQISRFMGTRTQMPRLIVNMTHYKYHLSGREPHVYAFSGNRTHAVAISQPDGKLTFLHTDNNVLKKPSLYGSRVINLSSEFRMKGPFTCNFDEREEYLFVAGWAECMPTDNIISVVVLPLIGGMRATEKSVVKAITHKLADFVAFDKKTAVFIKQKEMMNPCIFQLYCTLYQFDETKNLLFHRGKNLKLTYPSDHGTCEQVVIYEMKKDGFFKLLAMVKLGELEILLLKTFNVGEDSEGFLDMSFDQVVTLDSLSMCYEKVFDEKEYFVSKRSMDVVDSNRCTNVKEEDEEEEAETIVKSIFSPDGNAVYILTNGTKSRLFRINLKTSYVTLVDRAPIMHPFSTKSAVQILEPVVAYFCNGQLRIVDTSKKELLFAGKARDLFHLDTINEKRVYRAFAQNEQPDYISVF